MHARLTGVKLYLGPMTKNVVDGVLSFSATTGIRIGLIASRRQVDASGGYVNGWTTRTFASYVRERCPSVVVCRDHGGPGQGASPDDDGLDSLSVDAKCLDVVHIDPWKYMSTDSALTYTIDAIKLCSRISDRCLFEIGTEEAIHAMSPGDLDALIQSVRDSVPEVFHRVAYAVVQSGTALQSGRNVGKYDEARLREMLNVCRKHGVLSKEHNGDYLPAGAVRRRFSLGLDAINIAPELARLESRCVLASTDRPGRDLWFDLCMEGGMWKKWFPQGFDPTKNREAVLELCGHYAFSHEGFRGVLDLRTVSSSVARAVSDFIEGIL